MTHALDAKRKNEYLKLGVWPAPLFGESVGSSSFLAQHPFQQFKKNRRFYLRYDALYLALCVVISALMLVTRFRPITAGVAWTPWHFVVGVPVILYFLICAHLWIHNATHGNFPKADQPPRR